MTVYKLIKNKVLVVDNPYSNVPAMLHHREIKELEKVLFLFFE